MFKEATGPLKEALLKIRNKKKRDILNCNTSFTFLHLTNIYFQQRFLSIVSYWQFQVFLFLDFWLMDLLVPEIQEDFHLGIRTILTEPNVIPSWTAFNYKYVGYQVFPWFLKSFFFIVFGNVYFIIRSVLFSWSLNSCTESLKKNKANGEARKKQK